MRIGSASETAVNIRDGYSSFVITLYKRSLTAIETAGIDKLFFTFKNNSLSSGVDGKTLEECLNGWSRSVPNGANPLYCTSATAFGNKDVDDILPNEWLTPTIMSENGTKGETGLTTTTIILYKRSEEIPSVPQGEITYDFYSGEVTGSLSGWSTTLPDFNGKPLWGTNAVVSATLTETTQTGSITKEKWSVPKKIVADGKDGKSPVESYIDAYNFILVADSYGIVSASEYTTIDANVTLMQKGEYLSSVDYGTTLENGNFYMTRAENSITNTTINKNKLLGTKESVMLKNSASVILTITYKDFDGELGSFVKTIYIRKVSNPKEAEPMLFAWSSSADVFTPNENMRVWMFADKFIQFDNKLIGDFPLYNFVSWNEVMKAKSDDYPYLWCKYSVDGDPLPFSGRDGKNGLNGQYTAFQYYASTSDTTQQGGAWSDTMPSIAGGKYLWMRTQVVPAGGSISSSAWGTPVLAGTDISKLMTTIETTNSQVVELGDKVTQNTTAINANSSAIATKVNQTTYDDKVSSLETSIQQNATNITTKVAQSEYESQIQSMQSTIEQTSKKIALTIETIDGEQVVKYNGIVISEKDGEGNILIRADKILLDGSVTADKLDVNTLNSTYLTINGTLSNEVLDTVDTAKEGETVSIGSVDDTKCYLASQLKTKIKNTTSNTMSLFSKLGNLSGVSVLNNTDNSFFVESHFEYYKRFTALPFITNIRNAQGSIYYWPTRQYFSFATGEENPIRTSKDGYNWGYGTNSWASNQKDLFGRFALNRYEESPTLHCVCYKVGTTDPFRLMSTRDGYNFYNQATLARTSVDDSFFMYSSFDSYPVLVTEKHVYFIAPRGVTSFSANSDISVQVGDPLGPQSFHEITLPITPEKVFSGILLKTNSILCCALRYNSTKYFYFYKKSSSSWISFAVPDIIKNKNFSETNYYEIGDYLYIVAYKYVGKLNLTTLSSSSTIETMFSGSIYGVVPISNKYLVVLEYDPSLKTYSKHLYSETKRMGGLPANSSLVSSAFFYKTFPSPMGNICYIDDNTTVILSGANYPSLKVSMTKETYPTDVLAFESATDNYLGTIDSLLPEIPTDKQAVSTDLQLNLPTTIPSDMDTYRRIPTLFTQTAVYLSLASASVESYTRFDTTTNKDVVVPAFSGKPNKVTTSSQSLRINDTEYANSSWFIKNKTALAISFTPNAVAKGVYTGDLNPKEVDGESASARDIGNITPYDTITGREITANEKLIAGNIEAKNTSANIGSANQKFDNVYANKVNGVAADSFVTFDKLSTDKAMKIQFHGTDWNKSEVGYVACWKNGDGSLIHTVPIGQFASATNGLVYGAVFN